LTTLQQINQYLDFHLKVCQFVSATVYKAEMKTIWPALPLHFLVTLLMVKRYIFLFLSNKNEEVVTFNNNNLLYAYVVTYTLFNIGVRCCMQKSVDLKVLN
jgi:hypothetical protein